MALGSERNDLGLDLSGQIEMALGANDLRAQLLKAVIDNNSRVLFQRQTIQEEASEAQNRIYDIDEIVAATMAGFEGGPEDLVESKLVELSQTYGETYQEAQNIVSELTSQVEYLSETTAKHERLALLLLDSPITATPIVGSRDLEGSSMNISESEIQILSTNTLESNILRLVCVSQQRQLQESENMNGLIEANSQEANLLVAEKEDITERISNHGWVLKNPVQAAKDIKRRTEINKEMERIKNDADTYNARFEELTRLILVHLNLRDRLAGFYYENGGTHLTEEPMKEIVKETEEEEQIVAIEESFSRPEDAILQILESTIPVITDQAVTETAEVQIVKIEKADWTEIFGLDVLREESEKDHNFAQHYRNALSTLLFSHKLNGDVDIENFRETALDFSDPEKPKIKYKDALDFIDAVVKVKHLRGVYKGEEAAARIIALVYKHQSGSFVSHLHFVDLAKQILNEDLHGGDLSVREIVEVMLFSDTDNLDTDIVVEIADENKGLIGLAHETGRIVEQSSDKTAARRTLARGIVLNAIDSLNTQAQNEGMYYKFPVSSDTLFSKPQADKLMGGLANSRHRTYERGSVGDNLKMDTVEIIIASLWRSNRKLATNKSEMKKLIPVIREVYEEIYEASK